MQDYALNNSFIAEQKGSTLKSKRSKKADKVIQPAPTTPEPNGKPQKTIIWSSNTNDGSLLTY